MESLRKEPIARKYGEDQRLAIKKIREELIKQLDLIYLERFEQLNCSGLGNGAITKLTQLLLISRDGAMNPLRKEIEARK